MTVQRVYAINGTPGDLTRAGWHLLTVLETMGGKASAIEPAREGLSRRSFVKWTVAAAAVAVTDLHASGPSAQVERLLWTPDQRAIFIPKGEIELATTLRAATDAEVAQVTGQHFLRIKYRPIVAWTDRHGEAHASRRQEEILLISEHAFAQSAGVAFAGETLPEIHFDDGTIAYDLVIGTGKEALSRARSQAQAFQATQSRRRGDRDARARRYLRATGQVWGGS